MKRLPVIFAALLALCATAPAQTLKGLFYNTTNGQVVYSGTNALTFTNAPAFSDAATVRTNLGLGAGWLTNTSAADFRAAIGLGTAATNPASAFQPASANLTNLAANNAASLTNFPALLLRTNGSAVGLTNFPTLNQNTTGTASNVTGVVAIANGGTGATNASNARTALGLGETNSPTFSNLVTSGTLTATGNVTMSGTANTAPNQTAASASSIMTRELVDTRMVDYIMQVPNRFRNLSHAMQTYTSGTGAAVHAGPIDQGRVNARIANGSTNSFAGVRVNRQGPWNGVEGNWSIEWGRPLSVVVTGSKNQSTNNVTGAFLVLGGGNSDLTMPTNGNFVGLQWVSATNAQVIVGRAGVLTTNAATISTSASPGQFGVWIDHSTNGNGSIFYAEKAQGENLQKPATPTVSYTNGPNVTSESGQSSLNFGIVGLVTNTGAGFEIVGLNNAIMFAP